MEQGPGARGQGAVADKETRTAIMDSDFELRNYQRHDYQKSWRGEPLEQGPGARGQGPGTDKKTRRATLHSDFELRNYQRHDYQKSWRVAGGEGRRPDSPQRHGGHRGNTKKRGSGQGKTRTAAGCRGTCSRIYPRVQPDAEPGETRRRTPFRDAAARAPACSRMRDSSCRAIWG